MSAISSEPPERPNRAMWAVVTVILLVLSGALFLVTRHLRAEMRAQMIQQYGRAFATALTMPSLWSDELEKDVEDDPEFLSELASLKVVDVARGSEDVIAVRVFNSKGQVQLAIGGKDQPLSKQQMEMLREGMQINSYDANANLQDVAELALKTNIALVRALVPLYRVKESSEPDNDSEISERNFIGAAEFILDGKKVEEDLQELDLGFWLHSGIIFLLSGVIITGSVVWVVGRLQKANRLLAERTQSLLRANHELTLSAKTSAIGAITAHLIHDLKNPLFGLQSFVTARGSTEEEDWNIAQDTTERMQKVIGEIVRILREEKTTEKYELSLDELFGLLREKLDPQCSNAGIIFHTSCFASGTVMNRDANVILLVITNIVQNAIQATPRGGQITVNAMTQSGSILFTVRDTGPGLPEHIQKTLFTPSRSTKSNGTGLGLAISKQLANHIGAELSLKETSNEGTVFELRVPERVMVGELV